MVKIHSMKSQKRCSGFSLLEVLLTLGLMMILMTLVIAFLPYFFNQILDNRERASLNSAVKMTLMKIDKEIQRAGFQLQSNERLPIESVKIFENGRCLRLYYDLAKTGKIQIASIDSSEPDLFTYRYQDNNLEYKRGAMTCNGRGWFKLLDEQKYQLTEFKWSLNGSGIVMEGVLRMKHNPQSYQPFIHFVRLYNCHSNAC